MCPLVGLPVYPDDYFDLAIIDGPYGIGEDGRNNHTRGKLAKANDYQEYSRYDNEPPPLEFFVEAMRVSKNQIIWGANHFIDKIPFASSCWIIWDKQNGDNDFADVELAWTSFDTAARLAKFRWAGMLQGNMKSKEQRIHPNQKPEALMAWCLNEYAKPGDKILDTHSGSGSVKAACMSLGFDCTAYEIDPKHHGNAENRLSKGVNLRMF